MLTPVYSHWNTSTCFSPQVALFRAMDTFREKSQQKTCPDVNIRLKSSVLCVTWQLSVGHLGKTYEVMLVGFVKANISMKNYTWREITERKSASEDRHQHGKLHLKTDIIMKNCVLKEMPAFGTVFEDRSQNKKLNLKTDTDTKNCIWRHISMKNWILREIDAREPAFEDR